MLLSVSVRQFNYVNMCAFSIFHLHPNVTYFKFTPRKNRQKFSSDEINSLLETMNKKRQRKGALEHYFFISSLFVNEQALACCLHFMSLNNKDNTFGFFVQD